MNSGEFVISSRLSAAFERLTPSSERLVEAYRELVVVISQQEKPRSPLPPVLVPPQDKALRTGMSESSHRV